MEGLLSTGPTPSSYHITTYHCCHSVVKLSFLFPDACPRYLDVSLVVLARSPLTRRGLEEVVRLQVTLHREYTEGEWIVRQSRLIMSHS